MLQQICGGGLEAAAAVVAWSGGGLDLDPSGGGERVSGG